MPHRSSVTIPWRLKKHKYALVGAKCVCGTIYYPPKNHCVACGGVTIEQKLPNTGIVLSFTTIHTPPDGFEHKVPYTIGLIELQNKVIISSEIVGSRKQITIGSRVHAVFRVLHAYEESGTITYGTKFKVVE